MHIAIDDPSVITRTFVKAVMEYPFIQCDLTEVLALVDSANEKALNFDKRIGFQEVYRLEGAGAVGEDLILLRLRREECKWIRSESNGSNESVAGNASVSAGSADAGRRSQPS